ncbi:anti-sigma B factor antagonist/stage II sporulation protein AA (anti-sigma F factor antagonist) [Roseibium hamelinense]|uniref:Anti-sigma B factor antagonist/stage II sporulation protein AA (Anti-sigma F factor antagonist) n=1 Tax=Roseibium hamelinense TaxID=150831 RepID=A0A562SE41_9HYPH|nr:STAS domain-containing protein [Roseibium hamelinense]MTI42581.1 anti-sigma factor antagonist [Roseibium hamelinense]TWI79541.1 anti-sigma B factor antagonist/stage II sporulation protein AA (anti-sigma F factor antagonist) [Roseibium hamelinense]
MADSAQLTISDVEEEGVTIVCPVGRLETLSAKAFEDHLNGVANAADGDLLVDMSSVDYVTSFGLRSILIVAKQLSPSGRKLIMFSPNDSVMEVLRISGFLKIVEVTKTKSAAIGAANKNQDA